MAIAILNKENQVVVDGQLAVIPQAAERWLRNQPQGTEAFVKQFHYGTKVPNGEACTKTGYAQIVIGQNNRPTPVVGRICHGYMPDRYTYQVWNPGEIILSVYWGHGEDPTIVWELKDPNNKYDRIPYDFRAELSQIAIDWLQPRSRGESYLEI
jgi:hypothetical protein